MNCKLLVLLIILVMTLSLSGSVFCSDSIRDCQPRWSPDGKQIAFISNRNAPENAPEDYQNLWIVNADGTGLKQLTTTGESSYPSWSPDGKQIVFQSGRKIFTIETATGRTMEIMNGTKATFAPDWNPKDDLQIVCALRISMGENDLIVLDPQTCLTKPSGQRNVRSREGSDDRPRWSRDGKHIAFIGEVIDNDTRALKWYLMTIKPDGTGLRTYCEVFKNTSRPSWMMNDESILLDGGRVCNLATGKVTSLFGQNIKEPDVSLDGKQVVFCDSVRGESGQFIYVSKIDGSDKTQVTSPPSNDVEE